MGYVATLQTREELREDAIALLDSVLDLYTSFANVDLGLLLKRCLQELSRTSIASTQDASMKAKASKDAGVSAAAAAVAAAKALREAAENEAIAAKHAAKIAKQEAAANARAAKKQATERSKAEKEAAAAAEREASAKAKAEREAAAAAEREAERELAARAKAEREAAAAAEREAAARAKAEKEAAKAAADRAEAAKEAAKEAAPAAEKERNKSTASNISNQRLKRAGFRAGRQRKKREDEARLEEADEDYHMETSSMAAQVMEQEEKEQQRLRQLELGKAQDEALQRRMLESAQVDLDRFNVLLRAAGRAPVSDDGFCDFLDWKDEQPFAAELDPDDYVEIYDEWLTTDEFATIEDERRQEMQQRLDAGEWSDDVEHRALREEVARLKSWLGKRRGVAVGAEEVVDDVLSAEEEAALGGRYAGSGMSVMQRQKLAEEEAARRLQAEMEANEWAEDGGEKRAGNRSSNLANELIEMRRNKLL